MAQSKRTPPKSPASLPSRPEVWYLTVRKLAQWIEMDNQEVARPYLALLWDPKARVVLDEQVSYENPSAAEVRGLLWRAMLKPPGELRLPPHRPTEILCDQADLAAELAPGLAEIEVAMRYQEEIEDLDRLIELLEEELDEEAAPPGLLSAEENTPESIGDFYTAAAQAYGEAPWIYLSGEQPVRFEIQALGKSGYVQLLGNSGIEFGLLLYDTWADLERSYLSLGEPQPALPEKGLTALSYVTKELMSPEDLEAIRQYHWPVAAKDAYPLPMVMFADEVKNADSQTILIFSVLARALPEFVQQLEADLQGDYQPLRAEFSVPSYGGELAISLEYPAGSLRREAFPVLIDLGDDIGDELEDDEVEGFDEYAPGNNGNGRTEAQFNLLDLMESEPDLPIEFIDGDFDDFEGESMDDWLASPIAERNPALVNAMGLVYMAWGEEDPAERVQLARKALETSPDCAEAYLILAEDLAVNVGQALKYSQKGLDTGAGVLGGEFFEEFSGEFWKHIEARPYLRCLANVAAILAVLGRNPEALEKCSALLRLDPEDHLGTGVLMLEVLLRMNRYAEAYAYAKSVENPTTAQLYTQALLAFQQTGDSAEAKETLRQALLANPHVPDYLSGKNRLPADLPGFIYPGNKSEAIDYAGVFSAYWRLVPGAVDWLRKVWRAGDSPKKGPANPKRRKKR